MSIPEDFTAREINRAISEAENPRGMSTHDGKARVDAAILRRLLAERDALLKACMAYDAWADKTVCSDPELRAIRQRIRAAIDDKREAGGVQ